MLHAGKTHHEPALALVLALDAFQHKLRRDTWHRLAVMKHVAQCHRGSAQQLVLPYPVPVIHLGF